MRQLLIEKEVETKKESYEAQAEEDFNQAAVQEATRYVDCQPLWSLVNFGSF